MQGGSSGGPPDRAAGLGFRTGGFSLASWNDTPGGAGVIDGRVFGAKERMMMRGGRQVLLGGLAVLAAWSAASPELVSVGPRGIPAATGEFDMTPDGRFVVFESRSAALVPGDTNNRTDVFLRDRVSRTVQRVSVATGGGQANGDSDQPRITPDGRFVVFRSFASNLVGRDTNLAGDVFVRDVAAGVTWRASVGPERVQANGPSWNPRISDDGRVVSFTSTATNLDPRSTRIEPQVYVRDERYALTHVVSLAADGSLPNAPPVNYDLSADGNLVLFGTAAANMSEFADGRTQAYLYNRRAGLTTNVSMMDSATTFFTGSSQGILSPDGRFAVLAIDEFGDAGWFRVGVLLRVELATGQYEVVSADSFGRVMEAEVGGQLAVSTNGRFVAWISDSDQLAPDDANGMPDAFVRDMATGTTRRASHGAPAGEPNAGVSGAAMIGVADDGSAAYVTSSTNLGVPVDPDGSLVAEAAVTQGSAGLVFWDASGNRVLVGRMAGSRVANWEWVSQPLGAGWRLAGAGEFNRDGFGDVVAQHTASRLLAVGHMRGVQMRRWAWVSQIPNAGWRLVGVGDFARSGQSSLLFQHPATNRMVIARMDGTTVMGWWNLSQVPNPGWRAAAVADFDADGFADIAFQRDTTGEVTIALSRLGRIQAWRSLSQWPSRKWALRAAGDFDSDGRPDLVFQHDVTGRITIAFCDGVRVLRWAWVTGPEASGVTGLQLLGAGRF
jgi:hypothetical protein